MNYRIDNCHKNQDFINVSLNIIWTRNKFFISPSIRHTTLDNRIILFFDLLLEKLNFEYYMKSSMSLALYRNTFFWIWIFNDMEIGRWVFFSLCIFVEYWKFSIRFQWNSISREWRRLSHWIYLWKTTLIINNK